MAVTHNPSGFTGTVDQIDEARRFALGGGGRFKVNSSADWALTADAGVARQVNIAAGSGIACGVLDATTAVESLTFAANSGGTDRFDAVVATYDWSTMTVTFRVITGTTVAPVVVNTGSVVDVNKINWLPGLRYDAVLGIIRARPAVTTLAPADLYDVRLWGSWSNLNVNSAAFLGQIDVDPNNWIRETGGASARAEYIKQIDGTWRGAAAMTRFVKLTGTGSQSIPTSTGGGTVVAFNVTAKADTSLFTVSGGALTCVRPGWYLVGGQTVLVTSGTLDQGNQRFVSVTVNGVTSTPSGAVVPVSGKMNSQPIGAAPAPLLLAAGDVVRLTVLQDSGVAQGINLTVSALWAQFLSD